MSNLNRNLGLRGKERILLSWIILALVSFTWSAIADPDFVPGRILVKPHPGFSTDQIEALFRKQGVSVEASLDSIGVHILKVRPEAHGRVLEALRHHPNIEFAELDYLRDPDQTPNDPYFSLAWHLQKIDAPHAWDITTGSSSVVIAILDTGVDSTQPDLGSKLVAGWNLYDNNNNTSDVLGHGTQVAGAAAALSNNGGGVASPAWNCLIMPMRVSNTNGSAFDSTIANALTWAADAGARVANISYGVSTSATVTSAAQYFQSKGGVVTVSAGNQGTFISAADNPYVLTVGATDQNDVLASWSNTGNNVDLTAPGVSIATTVSGGSYGTSSGTSFSAPVVAGVAALVLSVNPSLSATQVQDILKSTADDLGAPGWDPSYGSGRVNVYKAVLAATGASPALADTTPPTATITSPANSSTVSGTVSIPVTASDNVAVTKVELYINGSLSSTSTTSATPTFSWNTTSLANGSCTLQAKAYDAAGNSGTSALVTVTVSNGPPPDTTLPTAQVTSPANGSTLSGTVSINISSSDNVGVVKVECYLDGALVATSPSAFLSLAWDTTTASNGSHTVLTKAYDAAGNIGISALVTVTVSNAPPPDTTAPSAQITSPANGVTVSGAATVNVTATDNVGVAKVELYVDGSLLWSTSSSSTPSFPWDTTTGANGSHTLLAKAYDAAGNIGSSALVTVTVSNAPPPDTTPPSAQITSPGNGVIVSGAATVKVTAADNVGVAKVELYVDGSLWATSTSSTPSFSWDTKTAANGPHSLQSRAYDAAGDTGTSALVSVTVSNPIPDTTPPSVQITSPANGSTVTKTARITVSATDNVAVTKVELYVDGKLIGTDTAAPYTFSWSVSKAARGAHTLQAHALDAAGNVGTSATVTIYK